MSLIQSYGFLVTHKHLVKSGKSSDAPLFSMEASESGVIALQAAASYTSKGGAIFCFADSTNAFKTKKSIPQCPEP